MAWNCIKRQHEERKLNVHFFTPKFVIQLRHYYLKKFNCDTSYPIVPSYTYNSKNLDTLIEMTDEKYKPHMTEYDNLDPAIACHWGPNAFGYIFVSGD